MGRLASGSPRSTLPSKSGAGTIALQDFDLVTEGQVLCDERLTGFEARDQSQNN